jgi:hypothetical protein
MNTRHGFGNHITHFDEKRRRDRNITTRLKKHPAQLVNALLSTQIAYPPSQISLKSSARDANSLEYAQGALHASPFHVAAVLALSMLEHMHSAAHGKIDPTARSHRCISSSVQFAGSDTTLEMLFTIRTCQPYLLADLILQGTFRYPRSPTLLPLLPCQRNLLAISLT